MNISTASKVSALALSLVEGIGPIKAKKLIAHFGDPQAVFEEKPRYLEAIPGIGPELASKLKDSENLRRAEQEIEHCEKNSWQVHYFTEPSYPLRMRHCEDGPLLLFQKGSTDLNQRRNLGIVGSRNMTAYGKDFLKDFCEDIRALQLTVYSGLAYGVDAQAHRNCVDNNVINCAVLAHGLDRIYPAMHRKLAESILEGGGSLLTEYPTKTNPDRENFPKRNRIIAALSNALVVVQAARKGGALITAELANTYNRDVFALPGRRNDAMSEGCNLLIKSQRAHLLESVKDLSYIMQWDAVNAIEEPQINFTKELDGPELETMQLLSANSGTYNLDGIRRELGLTASQALSTLMSLELKSLVDTLPGPRYRIRSR